MPSQPEESELSDFIGNPLRVRCVEVVEIVTHYLDNALDARDHDCLLYTSPSPRDQRGSRMPSSA